MQEVLLRLIRPCTNRFKSGTQKAGGTAQHRSNKIVMLVDPPPQFSVEHDSASPQYPTPTQPSQISILSRLVASKKERVPLSNKSISIKRREKMKFGKAAESFETFSCVGDALAHFSPEQVAARDETNHATEMKHGHRWDDAHRSSTEQWLC